MLHTACVAATIGPNDVNLHESPLPDLLWKTSGMFPVKTGTHVLLQQEGVESMRRLAMGDVGGKVIAAPQS